MLKNFIEAERYVIKNTDGQFELRLISDECVIYKNITIEEAKSLQEWLNTKLGDGARN